MRTILTERLQLEPVRAENATMLWDVLQRPDLRTYQDLPDVDLAQFKRMVAARPAELRLGTSGRFEWLIYLSGLAEPVGWVSLRIAERSASTAEVGYSVLNEFRGRGIAIESVRGLVDEAFSYLRLKKMRAYCVPENVASRVVLDRVGFGDDGVLPLGATVQGRPVDVLAHVLHRAAWEARRAATR